MFKFIQICVSHLKLNLYKREVFHTNCIKQAFKHMFIYLVKITTCV
jgi:hypothetical protein